MFASLWVFGCVFIPLMSVGLFMGISCCLNLNGVEMQCRCNARCAAYGGHGKSAASHREVGHREARVAAYGGAALASSDRQATKVWFMSS